MTRIISPGLARPEHLTHGHDQSLIVMLIFITYFFRIIFVFLSLAGGFRKITRPTERMKSRLSWSMYTGEVSG